MPEYQKHRKSSQHNPAHDSMRPRDPHCELLCWFQGIILPSSLQVLPSTQGGLQLSGTTNNTLMKTLIYTSSWAYVRISLGYISWSGIAGSGGMSVLIQLSEASMHSGIAASSNWAWGLYNIYNVCCGPLLWLFQSSNHKVIIYSHTNLHFSEFLRNLISFIFCSL